MKRVPESLILAFLVLVAGGRDATACSCAPTTLAAGYGYADFVFTGTVERVDTTDAFLAATIVTDEVFKGDVAGRFDVWTRRSSASCGYNDPWARFEVGEEFLLFATAPGTAGGDAVTYLCTRNNVVSEAQADLEKLRAMASSDTFLPATDGNTWTYIYPPFDTSSPISVRIEESVQVDDRTYITLGGLLVASDSLFLDAFGSLWWHTDGVDRPLLDFTTDEQGYVVQFGGATFDATIERDVTAHVRAGRFEGSVRFDFASQTTDDVWSFTLAPGVGLILISGTDGSWYELAGATVDGRVISSAAPEIPVPAGLNGAVHPNPTGGSATISFVLDAPARVRVSVHDALGREVTVLSNAVAGPGRVEVPWDASELPAGVYFLHVRTRDAHLTLPAVRI